MSGLVWQSQMVLQKFRRNCGMKNLRIFLLQRKLPLQKSLKNLPWLPILVFVLTMQTTTMHMVKPPLPPQVVFGPTGVKTVVTFLLALLPTMAMKHKQVLVFR